MKHTDPLKPILDSWRTSMTHAVDFEAGVWARIRAREVAQLGATTRRFEWALPLAASLVVLFSVAAGTRSALLMNQTNTTEQMATTYVRSIDPLQMTHHDAHDRS